MLFTICYSAHDKLFLQTIVRHSFKMQAIVASAFKSVFAIQKIHEMSLKSIFALFLCWVFLILLQKDMPASVDENLKFLYVVSYFHFFSYCEASALSCIKFTRGSGVVYIFELVSEQLRNFFFNLFSWAFCRSF